MVDRFWERNPWKFLIDQTAHFVWGFGIGYFLENRPYVAIVPAGVWFGREQQQGKSKRRFDPHIDWTFWFLGIWAGWIVRRTW